MLRAICLGCVLRKSFDLSRLMSERRSPTAPARTAIVAGVEPPADPTVEATVMVIAGVGPYGTEAVGEFVQSPQALEQPAKIMPSG